MKSILIVAGAMIYKRDGYRSRISMEIDILRKQYTLMLLIPQIYGESEDFGEDVRIYYYPTYHTVFKTVNRVLNAESLRKKTQEIIKETGGLVYCEGLRVSIILSRDIRKYRFVFDCHGTESDEYKLYHNNFIGSVIAKYFKKKETEIVRKSNAVVTVTRHQFELWSVSKPHAILPMLPSAHFFSAPENRKSVRTELGIPYDSIVFVYSGNNEKWQMCEETLRYYYNLEKNDERYFLVVYSHAEEYFRKLIRKMGIRRALVKHIDYSDMPAYLDACDFGFCLRSNHIINQVASPTKVMEYLTREVTPVLTEYVGDFSAELSKKNLAIVLSDDWDNPHVVARVTEERVAKSGKEYVAKMMTEYTNGFLEMIEGI